MDRRSVLIGGLLGGWLATLAFLLAPHVLGARVLDRAYADDPPLGAGGQQPNPNGPRGAGPTVNPIDAFQRPTTGVPNPGGGTADSNNTSIALAASIGSGQSAVWYFDTERQRVLVYAFETGTKGGLKLLAARHIDMDLKLEGYNDISDKSRTELKEAYEKAFVSEPVKPAPGVLPTKKVDVPGVK